MRGTLKWTAALVAALAACGDGGGTAPPAQDFAGTWTASRMLFTDQTNPNVKMELIGLGVTFTVQLNANGTYTMTMKNPGQPDDVSTGTWNASSDVFTMHEAGTSNTMQFDYTLAGGTLTMAGGHAEFDVDRDGTDEQTYLDLTLHK